MSIPEMINSFWAEVSLFVIIITYSIRFIVEKIGAIKIKRDEIRYSAIHSSKLEAIKNFIDLALKYYSAIRYYEYDVLNFSKSENRERLKKELFGLRMEFLVNNYYQKIFLNEKESNKLDACANLLEDYFLALNEHLNFKEEYDSHKKLIEIRESIDDNVQGALNGIIKELRNSLSIEGMERVFQK